MERWQKATLKMEERYKKLISLKQTKNPSVFEVQLNLEMETRYIGKLDLTGDGTFLTLRKPQHLFKKLNAIGINQTLLNDESIPFKWIVVDFEGHKLVTSRLYWLNFGKCFKFGRQGFELQCFLPLNEFVIDKARGFEARQVIQENLFSIPFEEA